jgi:hypothetical protein
MFDSKRLYASVGWLLLLACERIEFMSIVSCMISLNKLIKD